MTAHLPDAEIAEACEYTADQLGSDAVYHYDDYQRLFTAYKALRERCERYREFIIAVNSGGHNQEFKTWASSLIREWSSPSSAPENHQVIPER